MVDLKREIKRLWGDVKFSVGGVFLIIFVLSGFMAWEYDKRVLMRKRMAKIETEFLIQNSYIFENEELSRHIVFKTRYDDVNRMELVNLKSPGTFKVVFEDGKSVLVTKVLQYVINDAGKLSFKCLGKMDEEISITYPKLISHFHQIKNKSD
jgi:hypothetical protein